MTDHWVGIRSWDGPRRGRNTGMTSLLERHREDRSRLDSVGTMS